MSHASTLTQTVSRSSTVLAVLAAAALAACEVARTAAPPTDSSVTQVVITPDSVDLAPGASAQFAAYGRTTQGDSVAVAVTWSASGGSITAAGLYTADTSAGTFSISAQTAKAVHGSAKVHVGNGHGSSGPAPVASVSVSPASASITVGTTQAFTVVLQDTLGNVLTGRSVTWSSSAPTIAGISVSGAVTGLLAGSTTITATSEGKSGNASLTVTVQPPPPPPPSPGTWPNQPAGLTLLSDQPWNSLGGWQLNDNSAGATSLVTLSGLPFSPSEALQDLSPIGMTGGGDAIGPGRADFYIPAAQQPSEIYVGMWVKLSNPFQPHSSGVQKIMYVHDNNGINFSALWLEIYGTAAPFRASLVNQFYGCPSIRLDPNATQTPIGPGEWHRYELYLKMASTGSSSDGVLKVWVDGVLNVNRSDVCTMGSNATRMESVRLSGMWGGIGDTKTENDYLWYDHAYVSGR